MDNIDVVRGKIWSELGLLDGNINTYEIHQWTYLLKFVGIDMGFEFQWGLENITSQTLREYLYFNMDKIINFNYYNVELSMDAQYILKKVKRLVDQSPNGLKKDRWFKLLLNIAFLMELGFDNCFDIYEQLSDHGRQEHYIYVSEAVTKWRSIVRC